MTGNQRQPLLKTLSALLRLNLSLTIAFSAFAGSIIFSHTVSLKSLFLCTGVFLVSCAASAINQVQERRFDALMERTRGRPLVLKRISNLAAATAAALLGISGFLVLYFAATPVAALLAGLTLLWYNGVYTPLKRKTRLSIFIGSLAGAVPPVIGYTAAGGPLVSACLFISLFMFFWQISHVVLLFMKFGNEYERAGFRVLTNPDNGVRAKPTLLLFFSAAAGSTLLFPLAGIVHGTVITGALIITIVLFEGIFISQLVRNTRTADFNILFLCMNLFQLAVFTIIIAGSIWHWHDLSFYF